jgi:hypothetical protein
MPPRHRPSPPTLEPVRDVRIRLADPADRVTLDRLAALDSQPPLEAAALVAEIDGTAVAALALGSGRVLADPFVPTTAVIDLLRVRAAFVMPARRPARPLLRLRRRPLQFRHA